MNWNTNYFRNEPKTARLYLVGVTLEVTLASLGHGSRTTDCIVLQVVIDDLHVFPHHWVVSPSVPLPNFRVSGENSDFSWS